VISKDIKEYTQLHFINCKKEKIYIHVYLLTFVKIFWNFYWSPEFFWRDLWFQSIRSFFRNAFSPSLMSQIFWNSVYSLSGVRVRECQSLFYFYKIRSSRAKKRQFLALFCHFRSFSDLEIFLVNGFFWFFNMMVLGIFRSDLQKIVKNGSKFGPPGPKNGHFWPFFGHFCSFSDLKIFYWMKFSDFLIWCFWAYLEVICKKLWKKGQNSTLQGQKTAIFGPFFGHFRSFSDLEIFLVNEFFWFFNIMFLGIFRNDLQKILKKGSKFGPPGAKKTTIFGPFLVIFTVFWT